MLQVYRMVKELKNRMVKELKNLAKGRQGKVGCHRHKEPS